MIPQVWGRVPVSHKSSKNFINKHFNEKHKKVNVMYFVSINININNIIIYIYAINKCS